MVITIRLNGDSVSGLVERYDRDYGRCDAVARTTIKLSGKRLGGFITFTSPPGASGTLADYGRFRVNEQVSRASSSSTSSVKRAPEQSNATVAMRSRPTIAMSSRGGR